MSTLQSTARIIDAFGPTSGLTDDALLTAQRTVAAHLREVSAVSVALAAEIHRRSTRDLGHAGLAAREGFRSPVELIATVSGMSRGEAAKLVSVATSPSASSVASVGVDALDAINRGLGQPDAGVSGERLALERGSLLASGLTPDELFRRARQVRDELDATAVARREKQQREFRFWRQRRRDDGMIQGSYLLTPDDGALLLSVFGTLMSPRRGGPRFVDENAVAESKRVADDPRTDDQYAADGLVAMIDVAVTADSGRVFPTRMPAVKVIVRETDLANGTGHGILEDSRDPISIAAVGRHVCVSGVLGIRFDDSGQVIDLGREQRLHTTRQRAAIAARDGGCMIPDCGMPVSMTEVHHPNHWDRDQGVTSVQNGISLCRFHHMMIHTQNYSITHAGDGYWLIPPVEKDPGQTAIRLHTKNPLLVRTG